MMEVPEGWRRPHLKQPLDGPDGPRARRHGSSGLKSTTREHPEGPLHHETDRDSQGGLYNDFQVSDPINYVYKQHVEHAAHTAHQKIRSADSSSS